MQFTNTQATSLVILLLQGVFATPVERSNDIVCLGVGNVATAKWVNQIGETCTWSGPVGSNWGNGTQPAGDHECMGRCGAGCLERGLGNPYTQDCFTLDVCTWFYNTDLKSKDANCGKAWNDAIDDTWWGSKKGCDQVNPELPVIMPDTIPVCTAIKQ